MKTLCLSTLLPEHWDAVARIYAEGIATGNSTFETDVPAWEAWDAKHLAEHRLVAVSDGEVVGWAALSSVSERCVYAGVTEGRCTSRLPPAGVASGGRCSRS